MSLPVYQILTPTIVDSLQYPVGSRVGIDTATDKWEVNSIGMYSDACVYILSDPTDANYPNYRAISGGPCNAVYKVPTGFSNNQWVAAQCIVPLDGDNASYPGVRMNPTTGDGYYVFNMGHVEYNVTSVYVKCKKNGVLYDVPNLSIEFEGYSNEVVIDGKVCSDGFLAMLEVAGSNPVSLRLSILLPRTALRSEGHVYHTGNKYLTTLPDEVSPGNAMEFAYLVIGEYEQSDSNRILTGRPGILAGGINAAGGIYGFNAGEISGYSEPVNVNINSASSIGSVSKLTSEFSRYMTGQINPMSGLGSASGLTSQYSRYITAQIMAANAMGIIDPVQAYAYAARQALTYFKGRGDVRYPFYIKTQ